MTEKANPGGREPRRGWASFHPVAGGDTSSSALVHATLARIERKVDAPLRLAKRRSLRRVKP